MLLKICGITREEDTRFAVQNGADFIGVIHVESTIAQLSLPLKNVLQHLLNVSKHLLRNILDWIKKKKSN